MSSGAPGAGGPDSSRRHHYQSPSSREPPNHRFSNLIHDSELFLTKLREFKPQSLGCLEARRKSSSTLIFPSPPQACMGPPKCPRYPHDVKPTPGYWIECHGPGVLSSNGGTGGAGGSGAKSSCSEDKQQSTLRTSTSQQIVEGLAIGKLGEEQQMSHKLDDLKLVVGESGTGSGRSSKTSGSTQQGQTSPTSDKIHDTDVIPGSGTALTSASRQKSCGSEQAVSRDQSLRRRGSANQINIFTSLDDNDETGHQQQQDDATKNSPTGRDLVFGTAGSMAQVSSDQQDGSGSKGGRNSQETRGSKRGERRKRLGKRTMTRDDIDLHKTRRGTPNITITEPSFNQSTITYQPIGRKRGGLSGQESKPEDSSSPLTRQESLQSKEHAIGGMSKFHRMASTDSQCSFETSKQLGEEDSSLILRRMESNDSDEYMPSYEQPTTSIDLKPYRPQHHRPSIIREDIDVEAGDETQQVGQRDYYCGLSTTTFQKKPYHQAFQQPQQQQLQQTQQQQPSQQPTQSDDQQPYDDGSLELISFEEENYEKHYYGREHWNYFTNDELLGPVMLSLKQEVNNQRDHFHVLLRTVSYTLHGTIPASTICADRYDREAIVKELSEIAKLKPPLMLGQLPSTPDELLKLDHIFIKTELKVGVIYIKSGQADSEESILSNKEESPLFTEFLDLLGDRITLKGFDRYKGGLDTVHNLTGIESIYTMWRNIEIMFHVSTMLPHEENDPQKLQKKRHIGNDIVCVAFIESDDTLFWPGCIKSYFLHTFIAVQTSPKPLKEGERRKYKVSCVCRNEVQYAFKPYLVEQDEFCKSDYFREWLLVKIVNGERASYSAPKFARMQDRTRSQLLEDIITNLANHLVTGQIPKPYRRGSWRPLGHTRASSPLEDSMKDYYEDYDQLAKDFCQAFCGPSKSMLCDVVFRVKDNDGTYKLVHGVRAILAIRSRTFLEMLYGFVPPGTGPSGLQNQTNLRAIEMKALGEGTSSGSSQEHGKSLLAKRGSVGADSSRKLGEKERRQSMLPNLSKNVAQKPNYLTVPSTSAGGGGGVSSGSGTGGMIKNAFNRLVSGNW